MVIVTALMCVVVDDLQDYDAPFCCPDAVDPIPMSDVPMSADQSVHAQGSGNNNNNNNNDDDDDDERPAMSHGTATNTDHRDCPRKNTYLRRDKAAGKRSLLQQQLQQQGNLSRAGTLSAVPSSTPASSSSSKAGEPGTDHHHHQQPQQRQRVVAFGAATFKKALRGWSGVPGKRL